MCTKLYSLCSRWFVSLILIFCFQEALSQCPTLSSNITPVACTNGATGAITLSVSGDTANFSNPGLLISEIQTDPALADSPKEWVELIATRSINFAQTPYTVIFSNNGTATSKGWVEGNIPSPPPRNSTYAFQINIGSVQPGDVVYIGGTSMAPTVLRLREKNTSTEAGDGGIGGAFTGATGVLGNGGGIADGVAVFNLPVAMIDSNTVPVDAIFFGSGIGDAAMADTSLGFRLPVNDRYMGGRLKSSSFLAPEVLGFYSLQASGNYNRNTGVYSTPRTWTTNTSAWASNVSSITVSSYTYLWSNGATTKDISGLTAGTYTVTVTSGGCPVNGTYTVTQSAALNITISPGSVICNGATNGSIGSSVSGGVAPYTYLWSNGATVSSISNLAAGTYTLTITDANGCASTKSATVQQTTAVNVTSISPAQSNAGYPVALRGSGLAGITQVKFNGVNAAAFTISGDTLITATVPVNAGSGPVQLLNGNGCGYQSTATFTYLFSSPDLTVKLYIEGLYVSGGFMELPLVNSGLSGNAQHADSITLQLAQPTAPNAIVWTGSTILRSNGIAITNIPSTVIGQSFYIIVKHRSSIETWSKQPVLFGTNTYWNFSGIAQFPSLSTTVVSSLQNTTALSGGTISSDGGSAVTAHGVCWSTVPGPTVALASKTNNGSGTGSYTSNITGLSKNTTYYLRAYATNEVGTAYGNEISFTTLNLPVDIDGNAYDTVVIGTQVWMSKNLRVSKYRNGDPIPSNLSDATWSSTTSGAYAIYNNTSANDSIYGKLYNWYAVADPRGLCPVGWHVPSDAEWQTLETALGMPVAELNIVGSRGSVQNVGGKMKAISPLWNSPNTGADDSSGFSGLPGGARNFSSGTYDDIGLFGGWWSSTQHSTTHARSRTLNSPFGDVYRNSNHQTYGFSVRCVRAVVPTLNTTAVSSVQNTTAISGGTISSDGGSAVTARGVCWSTVPGPTVALASKTNNGSGTGSYTSNITGLSKNTTYYLRAYATNEVGTAYGNEISFTTLNLPVDIDGNAYDTVVIGTQVWMSKNLRVSKYRNGDPIPSNLSDATWSSTTSGAYAIYNNTSANDSIYGKLYNWYAVADPRGLCPVGWHVPYENEWQILEITLGMPSGELNNTSFRGNLQNIGGQIKAVNPLWLPPNLGATNSSVFTGLPAGLRYNNGTFSNNGYDGNWWTSTSNSLTSSFSRTVWYGNPGLARYGPSKNFGYSIRCIKNVIPIVSTSLITSISSNSLNIGGNVFESGGDSINVRGVCWDTNPNPTTALTSKTTNGTGSGSFTSIATGLQPNTTYYVKAYATNGAGTGYGQQMTFTTLSTGQFVDVDGNVYDTVAIGTQVWMSKNLRVSKYRNGDPITTNLTDASWQATNSGAYSIYNNITANDSIYGKLYNWYAVADPRGLCPTGWHVPSDAEWQTLESALGMPAAELNNLFGRGSAQNVGGQMKSVSPLWLSPNGGATNSSGFSGLPGGNRNPNGPYLNIGLWGYWWSSNGSTSNGFRRFMNYFDGNVHRDTFNKSNGFSVRCVRD